MTFNQKLENIQLENKSLLCIGLDSNYKRLPRNYNQYEFNIKIIEKTHKLVCAYKLNSAFYEALGDIGILNLFKTINYLRDNFPEIPIILDAKRGDIDSTNEGYYDFAFNYLKAHAITLHPYLGEEALKIFLDDPNIGCIILCKTSNSSSGEFQDQLIGGIPMYQYVATRVKKYWNKNNNCLLVVGATYPEELSIIRNIVGSLNILVPGLGSQGGDLGTILKSGLSQNGLGLIINNSREIIFASNSSDFAQAAYNKAKSIYDNINNIRESLYGKK